jgi:hypothetical protein
MTLEDKYWAAGFLDGTNASPAYEKKSEKRYLWKWNFSPPLNNDLLVFFRDNLGAKIVKRHDSPAIRFTKTALVEIIEKIGPYLRNRREVFEKIARNGKKEGDSVGSKNIPMEFPAQEFDARYQKHYAAGVFEASAAAYISFRKDDHAKFGVTLQRTLRLSQVVEKLLDSMEVKYCLVNDGKKPQISKSGDIIKVLSCAKNGIRFRKELIDFVELVKEVSIPAGTPKTKKYKVIYEGANNEQAIIEKNERNFRLVAEYNHKVNSYVFDESLVEIGLDGRVARENKEEKIKWIKEDIRFAKEAESLVREKTRRLTSTFRYFKSIVKKQLEIIQIQFNTLDRIEKNLIESTSDEAFCRDCKKKKPKSEFTINKANYHGVGLYCKSCVSKKGKLRLQDPMVKERNRQYYIDNKEKLRAYVKEYNKTYIGHKDDYDKYIDRTRIGSGEEFYNSSKDLKDLGITVHRGIGTHAKKFKLSKNDFFMHLEEEWRLLPSEIKDYYELPHELTAEEIFELRRKKLIELDHIIPKARIKALVQQGHARGYEVHPHHGLNLRPLPKELNCRRSSSFSLLSYYPNYKKRIKKIHRAIFQKYFR